MRNQTGSETKLRATGTKTKQNKTKHNNVLCFSIAITIFFKCNNAQESNDLLRSPSGLHHKQLLIDL